MKKNLVITGIFLLSLVQSWTQDIMNIEIPAGPLIGEEAPSFRAESTQGIIAFPADFGSEWKIVLAQPKCFTPVCSSEILELAFEHENFLRLGAKVVVITTDVLSHQMRWLTSLEEIRFKGRDPVKINFPLVDDSSYRISNLYGMVHLKAGISTNIRGMFIIDPENMVRAVFYYPIEVGRNIEEVKRTLMALQETYKDKKIATPVNWQPGDDVMVPVITSEERMSLVNPDCELYQLSWFMTYRKIKKE